MRSRSQGSEHRPESCKTGKKTLDKHKLTWYNKARKRKENKAMTKQEILNRIEKLEDRYFYLNMKDHWTEADYEREYELRCELYDLKKELKALQEEE